MTKRLPLSRCSRRALLAGVRARRCWRSAARSRPTPSRASPPPPAERALRAGRRRRRHSGPGVRGREPRGARAHRHRAARARRLTPFATVALRRGVSVPSASRACGAAAPSPGRCPTTSPTPRRSPARSVLPQRPRQRRRGPAAGSSSSGTSSGTFGVDAPQAWANVAAAGHPGGEGVIVAVLDTGVAYANHGRFGRSPDFRPNEFVRGYDFVSHAPYPEDHNGHGTQVAGTIAEATNNGVGVTGLAYGVRLMPVRVLDSQGDGDASHDRQGHLLRGQPPRPDHQPEPRVHRRHREGELDPRADRRDRLRPRARTCSSSPRRATRGSASSPTPRRRSGSSRSARRPQDGCMGYYSNYGSGLTLVAPGGGADADLRGDPNCHPERPRGRRHLPGDLRRRRVAERARVRPPGGLLRHLDGRAPRQRDRRADHRQRRARAAIRPSPRSSPG